MSDTSLFLGKFLKHGTAIASLAPSSPWLSRTTVRNVDWGRTRVLVELGAGTGPITKVIARRAHPDCKVVVLERDPDFARLLRDRFEGLANFEIIEGDVRDLAGLLTDRGIGQVDHVISGLPVPSFPKGLQNDLFRVVRKVLASEGTYNQITELPLVYWRFYRRFFVDVRFAFQPLNFPPAGTYFCRARRSRPEMTDTAVLSQIAGHRLVRSQVNRSYLGYAKRRTEALAAADPVRIQARTIRQLVSRARFTRFGRDHGFSSIRSVGDYQAAVPLRTYEDLWTEYLRDRYPVFEDLTWPGRIPYLALTSGTTQGATKYIPVSREMLASNVKAGRTMVAYHLAARPDSRLFHGKLFFLGGSSDLERPAPGVEQGDLSGITAREMGDLLRPYAFPPLDLALEPDWDRKLSRMAERGRHEPITLVAGVPSWLLALFQRLLDVSGMSTVSEVWPSLEVVVHGGVRFDPYRESFRAILGDSRVRLQESYPCSEGFVAFGDPETGLLRLCFDHGIFYEFVPCEELGSANPTRHWLGDVRTGVNYAVVLSTCAGLWAHVNGDTVRFESLSPPLLTFTGRTKYSLSAFGEHLINEEVEGAVASASEATGALVRDWHVGPVFRGALGYHAYMFEFLRLPADLAAFRAALDRDLGRRNADYLAHRAVGVGLPLPAVVVAAPGGFDAWMRSHGKLGGQHKLPRMDSTGGITREIAGFLRDSGRVVEELAPG